MGKIINWNGIEREVVRVKSDNPTHNGYYTTYRDAMKPGEEEFIENEPEAITPAEPIKTKKKKVR